MNWRGIFSLCWLRGHGYSQIVDCDQRRVYEKCVVCGHEMQYDFERGMSPEWIGFCDEAHKCPLCMGWKPRGWERCGVEVCKLNPNGKIYLLPDGGGEYRLDG